MSENPGSGQGREELHRVASMIMTLMEIDKRSQERLADEGRSAEEALQNVTAEIMHLEQAAREELQSALLAEEERLQALNSAALLLAEQRFTAISGELEAQFEAGRDHWVSQLISRILEQGSEETSK